MLMFDGELREVFWDRSSDDCLLCFVAASISAPRYVLARSLLSSTNSTVRDSDQSSPWKGRRLEKPFPMVSFHGRSAPKKNSYLP